MLLPRFWEFGNPLLGTCIFLLLLSFKVFLILVITIILYPLFLPQASLLHLLRFLLIPASTDLSAHLFPSLLAVIDRFVVGEEQLFFK